MKPATFTESPSSVKDLTMQSPRRAITEKDGMNRGVVSFVSSRLVEAYAQAFVRCIQCEGAITFTLKGRRTLPLN